MNMDKTDLKEEAAIFNLSLKLTSFLMEDGLGTNSDNIVYNK